VGEITGRPQKGITLLAPDDGSGVRQGSSVNLSWMETGEHAIDRVVVIDSSNAILLTALLRSGVGVYNVPPWIWEKTASRHILWSIEVLDENGEVAGKSLWRIVRYQE
jgi:hypothetical protein